MANRRMFSVSIVGSDNFLDMPAETRELYFQLGMYADDDGFISPKKIIRMIGASDDNLKVLIAKNFVIPFESGVIVITHWKESNYIQSDRYKKTIHQLEYEKLTCIQNVYKMDTQVRLGKGRKGKDKLETGNIATQSVAVNDGINSLIEKFKPLNPSYERLYSNTTQRSALERMVKKWGVEKVGNMIDQLPDIVSQKFAPRVSTPAQMEMKLGELKLFVEQQKSNSKIAMMPKIAIMPKK